MTRALALAYRFKPGRTFAQAAVAQLLAVQVGLLEVDWAQVLSVSGLAAAVSLLQIWGEGGDLFADDKRVTDTKAPGPKPGGMWGGG